MRQQTQEKIEIILSLYKREDISTREALRQIEEAMDRDERYRRGVRMKTND